MNERIRELYSQTANETADGKEWAIGGMKNAGHFAELIIQECIDYCGENLSKTVAGALKIHFGVEE